MVPANGASRLFWFITAVSLTTWLRALEALAWATSRSLIAVTPRSRSSAPRCELGLGEVELGLGGGEVGALDGVVDLRQVLAGLHLVVGLEEDRLDDAGGLDRELDALRGAGGADRLEPRLPGDGLDGRWWRR